METGDLLYVFTFLSSEFFAWLSESIGRFGGISRAIRRGRARGNGVDLSPSAPLAGKMWSFTASTSSRATVYVVPLTPP